MAKMLNPSLLVSTYWKEVVKEGGDKGLVESLLFGHLPPPPAQDTQNRSVAGVHRARRLAATRLVPIPALADFLVAKTAAFLRVPSRPARAPSKDPPLPLPVRAPRDHILGVLEAQSRQEGRGTISWVDFAERTRLYREEPFSFADWFWDILAVLYKRQNGWLRKLWIDGSPSFCPRPPLSGP